jgi:hypothetical protein
MSARASALMLFLLFLLGPCVLGYAGDWKRITPKRITPITRGRLMSPSKTAPSSEPVRSVRLIFEYEGDHVRLVSQQPVEMVVTGFDLPQADQPGYHVESRDANDKTLARVPARTAFQRSVEVFPERPGEPITRMDVAQPKGAFTVVVPVPEATHHVTVVQIDTAKPVKAVAEGVVPPPPKLEVTDLVSFPLNAPR